MAETVEEPTQPVADTPAPETPPVNVEAEIAKAREEGLRQGLEAAKGLVPQANVTPAPAVEAPKGPVAPPLPDYSLAVTDPDELNRQVTAYSRYTEENQRFLIAQATERIERETASRYEGRLQSLAQQQTVTRVTSGLNGEAATFAEQIAREQGLQLENCTPANLALIRDAAEMRAQRANPAVVTGTRADAAPTAPQLPSEYAILVNAGYMSVEEARAQIKAGLPAYTTVGGGQ